MTCRRGEGGFTLVELMVALALTSVVAAGITSVVISMLRTEAQAIEISDTLAEARAAVTRAQNELRRAKRLYPPDAAADCEPRTLTFWVDHDYDGELTSSEYVTYELVDAGGRGELVRTTGSDPANPLSERVLARDLRLADVFTCNPDPPDTRVVDIEIVVEGDRGLHTATLDGSVRLRNVD